MQKMYNRDTLIEQSPQQSIHQNTLINRRDTKKTAQLQLNVKVRPTSSLPVDSSARVKSPCITVQLEPVTVQQDCTLKYTLKKSTLKVSLPKSTLSHQFFLTFFLHSTARYGYGVRLGLVQCQQGHFLLRVHNIVGGEAT